jgi:hypothetical protein
MTAFAIVLLSAISTAAQSTDVSAEDSDTKLIDARVVEVTDARISVFAQTGVEHVIAVDRRETQVSVDGRAVSLKDLREGDVIDIELEANNPVKFARNISLTLPASSEQVARVRP